MIYLFQLVVYKRGKRIMEKFIYLKKLENKKQNNKKVYNEI